VERAAMWLADTMLLARCRAADALRWPWDERLREWAIERSVDRWMKQRMASAVRHG
jgi:hypothetical protein